MLDIPHRICTYEEDRTRIESFEKPDGPEVVIYFYDGDDYTSVEYEGQSIPIASSSFAPYNASLYRSDTSRVILALLEQRVISFAPEPFLPLSLWSEIAPKILGRNRQLQEADDAFSTIRRQVNLRKESILSNIDRSIEHLSEEKKRHERHLREVRQNLEQKRLKRRYEQQADIDDVTEDLVKLHGADLPGYERVFVNSKNRVVGITTDVFLDGAKRGQYWISYEYPQNIYVKPFKHNLSHPYIDCFGSLDLPPDESEAVAQLKAKRDLTSLFVLLRKFLSKHNDVLCKSVEISN